MEKGTSLYLCPVSQNSIPGLSQEIRYEVVTKLPFLIILRRIKNFGFTKLYPLYQLHYRGEAVLVAEAQPYLFRLFNVGPMYQLLYGLFRVLHTFCTHIHASERHMYNRKDSRIGFDNTRCCHYQWYCYT